MNNWQSLPSRGGLIGIILTILSALVFGVVLALTLANALADASAGANPGTFLLGLAASLLLLLTIFLAWRSWCFFKLRYYLDRNAITVGLGDSRQIIPLGNILEVSTAESLLTTLKELTRANVSATTPPATPAPTADTSNVDANQTVAPNPVSDAVSAEEVKATEEVFSLGQPPSRSTTATKAAPKTVVNNSNKRKNKRKNRHKAKEHIAAADSSFDEPLETIVSDATSSTVADEESLHGEAGAVESEAEIVELEVIEAQTLEDTPITATFAEANATEPVQIVEGEVVQAESEAETATPTPGIESEAEASTATNPPEQPEIPAIQNIQTKNVSLAVKMDGWRWPGYYFNLGYFPPLGQVQFYATVPFARTVLIRTYNVTYALSPTEPQRFITELKLRRSLGATEQLDEIRQPGAFLAHPLWHDWLGRCLILLGVLCNLALFGWLLWNFIDLPPNVQIHFDKFGIPDRAGTKGDLMWLPLIGLIAVVVNSVAGAWVQVRDKVPAYLMYIAAVIVQFLIALALLGILGGNSPG